MTTLGLRRLIKRFRPDIVHAYGWYAYSAAAALLGEDTPLLLTARDYAYSCAKRTLMYRGAICSGPGLAKCVGCAGRHYGRPKGWTAALGVLGSAPLLRRKVRGLHSISGYVQAMIRRDFVDDRRRNTSPGYMIHDVIGSVPEELERPNGDLGSYLRQLPDEPFLLFVGALRRVKGVEQLLEAYRRLDDAPPLVLVGTIERDSPSEFPPGVHVLRDFPHEAVMRAWERCLFGVLPSLWPEPFGTVVCEAMSRAKAVVGTAPGGHEDMIVDGETGYLVPAGDVDALQAAMARLIADPLLRRRMGAAGEKRAELFTAQASIPRIEQIYEELVDRRRKVA